MDKTVINKTKSSSKVELIKFFCNICKQKFNLKNDLDIHMKGAHFGMINPLCFNVKPINLDDVDSNEDNKGEEYKEMLDPQYLCEICTSIFNQKFDLDEHLTLAHPTPNDYSEIKESVKSLSNELSNITSANKQYTVILNHSVNKGNVANLCNMEDESNNANASTIPSNILEKHSLSNYNRVVCNICVEEFASSSLLSKHIKIEHFGVKSYTCAMCSESFVSREHVIRHYNICRGGLSTDIKFNQQKGMDLDNINIFDSALRKSKRKKLNSAKSQKVATPLSTIFSKKKKQKYNQKSLEFLQKNKTKRHSKNERSIVKPKSFKQKLRKRAIVCNKKDPGIESSVKHHNLKATFDFSGHRKCFICKEFGITNTSSWILHMRTIHSLNQENLDQVQNPKFNFNNELTICKCLRCGKEIVLTKDGVLFTNNELNSQLIEMEIHLQFNCTRAPFTNFNKLTQLYCTVCGIMFKDEHTHDMHVAFKHYPLIYKSEERNAFIPFPHILFYRIPAYKVHNKLGLGLLATSPYVCPYNHESPKSFMSIELLLKHARNCDQRHGVLALQCNICFKMLLCNNSPDQINQLKEVIKLEYLQCCDSTGKTFKCYCCEYNYNWNTITHLVTESISRIDRIRSREMSGQISETDLEDLQNNPTIHFKDIIAMIPKPIQNKCMQASSSCKNQITKQNTLANNAVNNHVKIHASILKVDNDDRNENNLNVQYNSRNLIPVRSIRTHVATAVRKVVLNNGKCNAATQTQLPMPDSYSAPCSFCNPGGPKLIKFNSKESYIQHMMNHESLEKLSTSLLYCHDCNSNFSSKMKWKNHIKNLHPDCVLLKCEAKGCDKEFQRPSDLQDHIFHEH